MFQSNICRHGLRCADSGGANSVRSPCARPWHFPAWSQC